MKKRMDSENRREKYLKVRVNEDEVKEFEKACTKLKMNKSDLIREAIMVYLNNSNIQIWE